MLAQWVWRLPIVQKLPASIPGHVLILSTSVSFGPNFGKMTFWRTSPVQTMMNLGLLQEKCRWKDDQKFQGSVLLISELQAELQLLSFNSYICCEGFQVCNFDTCWPIGWVWHLPSFAEVAGSNPGHVCHSFLVLLFWWTLDLLFWWTVVFGVTHKNTYPLKIRSCVYLLTGLCENTTGLYPKLQLFLA